MIRIFRIESVWLIAILAVFWFPMKLGAQSNGVDVVIHLRGVDESKISLMALNEARLFKPIIEVDGIRNGEKTTLQVPRQYLPGEFVLRFDYKEQPGSTPYPSEKSCFIADQSWELYVQPQYCNDNDSTWFQEGEKENTAFMDFSSQSAEKLEEISLLRDLLLHYDDSGSNLYKECIREYEKRRKSYNQWVNERIGKDENLFVSTLYPFHYISPTQWKGSEQDRLNHLIDHYLDEMDFSNPMVIRTARMGQWMDNYVNLYGRMATTLSLRDSLFSLAGFRAIEKAKKGNPQVYGWMVDYFYRGYETNGIDAGMKVLEPYLDDPNCLTNKRKEINRRLKGMETLVPGRPAPEISMKDNDGSTFLLSAFNPGTPYTLLLFWSAGCSHCVEMVEKIYPWSMDPAVKDKMTVVAISLDEKEEELKALEKKKSGLTGWKHLHAPGGVNSKVAIDYFVLATPVMVVVDNHTATITGTPGTFEFLKALIR